MNTTTAIQSTDFYGLFTKYRRLFLTLTLLSMALFTAAAYILPKRYKSSFTLSIYSSYFQNPMIRDFTSEIFDTTEMRAQRESLIRQSLTPAFVDSLGEKYGIYADTNKGWLGHALDRVRKRLGIHFEKREMRTRSEERHGLLSRIELVNLNTDTFQISFLFSDPDVTFHAIQDVYNQITTQLLEIRRNNLMAVRDAIQKRLDYLATKLPTLEEETDESRRASATPTAKSPEDTVMALPLVEEELSDVRSQLQILRTRYTEEHPLVKELRDRERELSALTASTPAQPSSPKEAPLAVRVPQHAAEEIYRDLTKKLNYLTVALDSDQQAFYSVVESPLYPSAPLWPKKGVFLLWGFCAGLLASFFIAAIREYFERTIIRPSTLSDILGVPYLGELPVVRWGYTLSPALPRLP